LLVENEHNNKLNNFIATSFENRNALKLNDFGTKCTSFAQVAVKNKNLLKNNQSNEKKIDKTLHINSKSKNNNNANETLE